MPAFLFFLELEDDFVFFDETEFFSGDFFEVDRIVFKLIYFFLQGLVAVTEILIQGADFREIFFYFVLF